MLNQEFYNALENVIDIGLEKTNQSNAACDGILPPENEIELSKKHINDNRKLKLIVYILNIGNEKFELILHFGNKSLSKCARGLSIIDSIPNEEDCLEDWFYIDVKNQVIEIQLK